VRSRKAGHVELFCRSSFVISRVKNSWDIVSQAETVEPHAVLREDLLRGTHARYAVELLDRFFAEGEGGPALFDLLTTHSPGCARTTTPTWSPASTRSTCWGWRGFARSYTLASASPRKGSDIPSGIARAC
jgi:recombinational DNA repair protein (RecF pathway)